MIKRLLFYVAAFAVSLFFASNAYATDDLQVDYDFKPKTLLQVDDKPVTYATDDYSYGFFDLSNYNDFLSSSNVSTFSNSFDNNLDTYTVIKSPLTIKFNKPLMVSSFYTDYHGYTIELFLGSSRQYVLTDAIRRKSYISLNKKIDTIKISALGVSRLYEFELFTTDIYRPVEILSTTQITDVSAMLNWRLPQLSALSHITVDGVDVGKSSSYLLKDLKPSTQYTKKIVAIYNDGVEISADVTFTTDKAKDIIPPADVTDFKGDPDKTFVNLSWDLPTDGDYQKLLLYRDNVLIKTLTTDTSYKDEKLNEDTTYKYKIVTVDESGNKSDGKTITVLTKSDQDHLDPSKPEKIGDNWVINWTKPTTGKIKVLVGGTEYKIVNASNLKVVIPHADMIFDIWGNPDVQLIHIAEDGTTQPPVLPPGGIGDIDLGDTITANNLLKIAMGLFALVASIVLLRMSFIVVPKLIKLIKNSYRGGAK